MLQPFRSLVAVMLPLLLAAPALAGGDWTGKIVILKGGKTVKIGQTDDQGKQVYFAELRLIHYRVIKEEGGWLKVRQDDAEGWFDKADVVVLEEAVDYFTGQIRANPKSLSAYHRRATAWRLRGELDIAIKDFGEAIRLDPSQDAVWNGRAIAWAGKNEYDTAIKDYDEAIRLKPNAAIYFSNRGISWSATKEYDKAIKDYEEAFRLTPKFVDAYNNTAWLLATCPDAKVRNGKRAVDLATKACELSNWKDANKVDTLAAGYAEDGRFDQAVKYQLQALADSAFEKSSGEAARQRLELYKQKKAYHQK